MDDFQEAILNLSARIQTQERCTSLLRQLLKEINGTLQCMKGAIQGLNDESASILSGTPTFREMEKFIEELEQPEEEMIRIQRNMDKL